MGLTKGRKFTSNLVGTRHLLALNALPLRKGSVGLWLRAWPLELDSLSSSLSSATYCVISFLYVIPVNVQKTNPYSAPEAVPDLRGKPPVNVAIFDDP